MSQHLIALAGNPNCGKTSLFNTITGARQHVANYPGVTVERREGLFRQNGTELRLVDLPGTYSLTAYSLEELVARNVLVTENPSVVVNIVDASNLDRNLYLTVQLFELGIPVIVALNMVDVASGRGIEINAEKLSKQLGVPVIPTVARSGQGKEELLGAATTAAGVNGQWSPRRISYGSDIDLVLSEMESGIEKAGFLTSRYPARWTALKYLEGDDEIVKQGADEAPALSATLLEMVEKVSRHLEATLDTYPEAVIADHRYGFIAALLKSGVIKRKYEIDRLYLSDKIDLVLTNRFFGPVIMGVVLYALYSFAFTLGKIPVKWLQDGFSAFSGLIGSVLPEGLLRSLITKGIIEGVGGVLGFVPLIFLMFLGIAFLEDSGYLARAAFMLDRVFRMFGLHGNSFMAYIVGGGIAGGCGVPGVMATRTLRSSRERLATILTVPFMNCGAKLPVYALLIGAFFAENEARIMLLLTFISWSMALLISRFLRSTILKGPSTPFLLELPPYRLPTLRGLLIHTWERVWLYIRKAGTILLGVSIIFWALMNVPGLPESEKETFEAKKQAIVAQLPEDSRAAALEGNFSKEGLPEDLADIRDALVAVDNEQAQAALKNSVAGRLGTALESVTRLCGFDWRTNVALVGGFAAKEIVVSVLGTAYSMGEVDTKEATPLRDLLSKDPAWNPLVAFTLIIFIMLYVPCVVSIVCLVREAGSWKWGLFAAVFNTAVAFLMAVLIYQGGRLLGIGA